MFSYKKKYFLIIKSIHDINLNKMRANNKFYLFYRNAEKKEIFSELLKFRNRCKLKKFSFFVANDVFLARLLNSDGIYLSSWNTSIKHSYFKQPNKIIIGSAHTVAEMTFKIKQGCNYVLVSKLFKVDYAPEEKFYGVIKFNKLLDINKKIIPLGGIKLLNLNKLKTVRSEGFALMSEIKKKPAISNRLF